jgi:hypothetical protein
VLHAQSIYEEDFELIDSGWSIGDKSIGEISFAAGGLTPAGFSDRSLSLSHDPEDVTRMTSLSPAGVFSIARTPDQIYSFQYDFRVSRLDTSGFIMLYDRNQTNQFPMMLQITNGGDIIVDYYDGSANTSQVLIEDYEVATTYTAIFTTNPSTSLFSMSISGSAITLEDVGFRRRPDGSSPFSDLNALVIMNDGGSGSGQNYDIFVDNVIVTAIPEPSAMAGIAGFFVLMTILFRRRR